LLETVGIQIRPAEAQKLDFPGFPLKDRMAHPIALVSQARDFFYLYPLTMAITRDQKTAILDDLKQKFQDAKGIVFAQYRGLSVEDAQELRRGLRESNVDYKVAKKTLIKLAAKEMDYDIPTEVMDGPIGVAFGFDDEIVAAQKVQEFAKKFESLSIMGGFMEGKAITADVVIQLASIPSRDVLLAQMMGSMMSPLTGFVGIGNGVTGGFVRVLNAYREQREEGGETPPPVEEPKAEEAPVEETAETPVEDAPTEEPAAEEAKADEPVADAPAEEAAEEITSEAPAEEDAKPKEAEAPAEAPAEEATPAEEPAAEETPKDDAPAEDAS
jgi:large subunit ribosomal protein L10